MPEPGGPTADDAERILREVVARSPLAGLGVTGHLNDERNVAIVTRLLTAAGL